MLLAAKNTTLILQQIRLLMVTMQYPLTAYIVPSGDQHRSLRMADCDQRRAFVTGFDGSAGIAVITQDDALLWTDARYFLQVEQQVDENWTLMKEGIDLSFPDWMVRRFNTSAYIGLDPKYYGKLEWDDLQSSLDTHGLTLTSSNDTNLVDLVWNERPDCPKDTVRELDIHFSGQLTIGKVRDVRERMEKERADILVVTELDEIAWLLNLRGTDLPLAPVFNSYVILTYQLHQIEIFIDESKISEQIRESLRVQFVGEEWKVIFYTYEMIFARVEYYARIAENLQQRIWISKYCNAHIGNLIPTSNVIMKLTPINLLKAVKNPTEVFGMKAAHLRDSASIVLFLSWLEQELKNETQVITEIAAAEKLTSIKAMRDNYVSQSFKTISASGPNGAIVHYFPVEATNRNLSINEMYLLDSGSHFLDGTTDITRTLHFGEPTDFQRACYSRVLKGHIAVATSTFPISTTGHYLDSFARRALWDVGLDYGHGTGHGIGAYLNVGEGPHSMASRFNPDDPGLRENMFMSNEPGYYEAEQFGIRLENIVCVTNSTRSGFLQLETISWVPFRQNLIERQLLTEKEIQWINEYHYNCRQVITEYIRAHDLDNQNEDAIFWLNEQTKPIVYSL